MNRSFGLALVCMTAATVAGSVAFAQSTRDNKPKPAAPAPAAKPSTQGAAPQTHEMPPGMSEADMQACMAAATPGAMHQWLAQSVGTWAGKTTMWHAPGMEPMKSECTSVITPMMDGRFTRCEVNGDMPGMGPFSGFGIYGFDNVSQKFQSAWLDNCGTGIMVGTGELSSDKTTLTWNFTYNCPIAKGPKTMREVERHSGKNSMTLEMYGPDPATGKEFKMMEIAFTRQPSPTAVGSAQ
jgi:hypothetical protein